MKDYEVTFRFTKEDGTVETVQFRTADICIDEYEDINGALDAADSFAMIVINSEYDDFIEYEIVSIVKED